jgi:hypothetical protein
MDCPNIPAGQFKHDASEVDPSWLLNVPAGHLVHVADPAVENVPLGHVTQAEAFVEPCSAPKVPAGHCMQLLRLIWPVDALQVPAGHLLQCDWPSMLENVPAPQARQSLTDLAPIEENVPALHGMHGTSPVMDHVPPGHCCRHFSSESEPADEDNPSGQFLHSLMLEDPVIGLNVLCGHFSQSCLEADPTTVLYVPSGHLRQAACDVALLISL